MANENENQRESEGRQDELGQKKVDSGHQSQAPESSQQDGIAGSEGQGTELGQQSGTSGMGSQGGMGQAGQQPQAGTSVADRTGEQGGTTGDFNLIVAPVFLNRPGDPEIADQAEREELPTVLDYIESVAPGGDGYLVGDKLSLADIAVAGPFANLQHLKIEVDEGRWPNTAAFTRRILSRPSFAPWVAREAAFLAKTAA